MQKKTLSILLLFLWSTFTYACCCCTIEAVNNTQYYPTLCKLIKKAKKKIYILGLSMDSRKAKSKNLIKLLKKAHKREVTIKVLLEGDKGWLGKNNRKTIKILQAKGIQAKPGSRGRLIHAKLIIVDKQVLIGSTNLTQNSMDNNNEVNFLLRSTDAHNFYTRYFQKLWKNSKQKLSMIKKSAKDNAIYFTNGKFLDLALSMIDNAKKEICLMMYMFKADHPVTKLINKLIEAKKRGVKVKIVLEGTYRNAFNAHIHRFNKYTAKLLKKGGIRVVFDHPRQITHSKLLICDKKVLISSHNWYYKGILKHHQTGLITRNKKAYKEMRDYFMKVYNKYK